jgi:hypothetical protein
MITSQGRVYVETGLGRTRMGLEGRGAGVWCAGSCLSFKRLLGLFGRVLEGQVIWLAGEHELQRNKISKEAL